MREKQPFAVWLWQYVRERRRQVERDRVHMLLHQRLRFWRTRPKVLWQVMFTSRRDQSLRPLGVGFKDYRTWWDDMRQQAALFQEV